MEPYVFGVDLGGTSVKLGVFRGGRLLEKWEIPTRKQERGMYLLSDITEALNGYMRRSALSLGELQGIGLGVPGAVLRSSYVAPCANLEQWGGFDVAEALRKRIDLPVRVINDANAAALGEMKYGAGEGTDNAVMVTLGTGVGGGILSAGRLLTGAHGAGGEIGHIKVSPPMHRLCGCGKSGCLEQYASATGVVALAQEELARSADKSLLRGYLELTCKNVFDCAWSGDEMSLRIVEQMSDRLAKALAIVSCVCDPEMFLIGGGVARAGELLLERIQTHFADYAFQPSAETEFRLAKLGNDAGIYGAAEWLRTGSEELC